jgi:hypothetical protein
MSPVRIRAAVVACLLVALTACSGSGSAHTRPAATTSRSGPAIGPASSPTVARLLAARWQTAPRAPLPVARGAVIAPAGRDVVVLGGARRSDGRTPLVFDRTRGAWRALGPLPVAFGPASWPSTAWTGSELALIGDGRLVVLLDPVTGRTREVELPEAAGPDRSAIWQAGRILVASARSARRAAGLRVWSIDGATLRVAPVPVPGIAKHWSQQPVLTTAGDGVLLLSGWSYTHRTGPSTSAGSWGIDAFRLSSTGFTHVDPPEALTVLDKPVDVGGSVWFPPQSRYCGTFSCPFSTPGRTAVLDPTTLTLTALPRGPLDRSAPTLLWTGKAALAIGGSTVIDGHRRTGKVAVYDPTTRRWSTSTQRAARPDDWYGAPVWSRGTAYLLDFHDRLHYLTP